MKKTLLTLSLFGATMMLQAQIIFNVLNPEPLQGNYEMTHASDWALTPDLANPANAVTGELAFASDGSAADSLGCLALTNGADIAGKIAVIYRGTCQFGTKALNANVAGAIAVVIINNAPGSPVGMGSGDVGDQVTVPVVMISSEAGALLRAEIEAGNLEAFIGNKLGLFDYDLGFFAEDIYLPNGNSIPSLVAQNGTEYNYTPAAWLHNYGSENTAAAKFTATVTFNGTEVYSQSVTGISMNSGENLYVSTPAFSPASWTPGLYVITLSASYDPDLATQNYVSVLELSSSTVGSGYSSGTNVSTTTNGSGTGLTLDIVAVPMNTVAGFDLSSLTAGNDYVDSTNVSTGTNNNGTGLTVNITTNNGGVNNVTVNQAGSGYAVGDLITIFAGDSTASILVDAVNAGGEVNSYTINNVGSGYAIGDSIFVDGGDGLAIMTVTVVLNEAEEFEGDNTYSINLMISDNQIFTRSSVNADGTLLGGPGFRTADGTAFSACVAYTHPNASRMALSGMHFGATGAAGVSIANEVLGLTVWRMNTIFTDINDPAYSVDVTLVANADFDIPDNAENGDIFFTPVRTGDDDFLILEDNARYVFCVGTDNPDIFILFDGGGLDNRRQYEGLNGNAQPDYYIYTDGIGRFTDFYGLPAIGVEFFDKNLVSTGEENIVDVTPYPNPTTEFLNIPLNNMSGSAQLNIFDANGRLISTENVSVDNNTLTVDVQNMATGIYTFTMAFENGKTTTFKVMINK